MSFIRSYMVLEGFPNIVCPSYLSYMTCRALKVYYMNFKEEQFNVILCNVVLYVSIYITLLMMD
ncbi:hypothetical protein Hanom_Chr16g01459681 [Helianthus anomalus]